MTLFSRACVHKDFVFDGCSARLRWIAFVVKVFFVVVGRLVALVFCIVKICLLSFLLLPIILKADVLLSH